jgi:hypothetical protein
MTQETTEPSIAIAVLFERLGHVIEKVDALSVKLDQQEMKRTEALEELEERVEHIERQVSGVRWFLAGVAIAGGAVGGSIAAGVAKMIGSG